MARNEHPELLGELADGVASLASSASWLRYLDFQSRFHRYSPGNVLLIASQYESATRVAGFGTWQKLNRCVRKGERAIWILAPMIVRNRDSEETEPEDVVKGFRFVPVFDVAQTDGEPLPSACSRLLGDDPPDSYTQLVAVADSIGYAVVDHDFDGGANGDCSTSERRIRVNVSSSPRQRVKTLAHELAHALLHQSFERRSLAELEAESTAYVVCRHMGIDSGRYSFGYVASWAGGSEEAVHQIKASCGRIQRAATTILDVLEPGGG